MKLTAFIAGLLLIIVGANIFCVFFLPDHMLNINLYGFAGQKEANFIRFLCASIGAVIFGFGALTLAILSIESK